MEKKSKLEKFISQFTKNYLCTPLFYEKLGKKLHLVYLNKIKHEIQIYDEDFGIQEIAKISYSLNHKGVYISDFIVNLDYQRKGIGKMLFNMVALHGYNNGKSLVYGVASPTDSIAGVSDCESLDYNKQTFIDEMQTLKIIYQKLGCVVTLNEGENEFALDITKQPKVSKEIELFVEEMNNLVNREKSQD